MSIRPSVFNARNGIRATPMPRDLTLQNIDVTGVGRVRGKDISTESTNYIYVSTYRDFPNPTDKVIHLKDNTVYVLTKSIDLLGCYLQGSANSVILGTTSETSSLISTGLDPSTAIIQSSKTLVLRFITITSDKIFDLDATNQGRQVIEMTGVNLSGSVNIGTIKSYENVICFNGAILNASGLVFDGTIGTLAFDTYFMQGTSDSTLVTLPSTLTLTRRMRINNCTIIATSGQTGLVTSPSVSNEGLIASEVNFTGGGTYISGSEVPPTSNKWVLRLCNGIKNSSQIGIMRMSDNTTATVINTSDTFTKINGITTPTADIQKFSHTNNRLTYVGAFVKTFIITVVATVVSGNNNVIKFGVYYSADNGVEPSSIQSVTTNSGGRAENITLRCAHILEANDYIEIHTANATATTDITIESMYVTVQVI